MGRYFEVLNRLAAETPPGVIRWPAQQPQQQWETEQPTAPPASEPHQQTRARASIERIAPPVSRARTYSADLFTPILDRLREHRGELAKASVMVAPVSAPESVLPVVDGLAESAGRSGLRTLSVRALPRNGGLAMELRGEHGSEGLAVPADLRRLVSWRRDGSGAQEIQEWLEKARGACDFVVFAAPPLLTGEASRLGQACDGVVLVVQAGATQRRDLEIVANHARTSECTVLGLVFAEPVNRITQWLRSL